MYDFLEQYCIDNRDTFYRLAYAYTKNKEDALDAVSEATLKALKNKKKLKDPAAVKTWMYRIVVNASLDILKSRKDVYSLEEGSIPETEGRDDTYQDFDLKEAVDELDEPYHTIIILRFFEDLKIDSIAEILKQNVNTTKTQLYSALKKLRITLS